LTERGTRTAFLLTLILAQQLAPARGEPAKPAGPNLPADAAAFVERRTGCNHWAGEDPYDAARGRQIAAAIKALGCDAVEADERRLRQRHSRDPAVLRALDRASDADG
jgi:hypothetical protein